METVKTWIAILLDHPMTAADRGSGKGRGASDRASEAHPTVRVEMQNPWKTQQL